VSANKKPTGPYEFGIMELSRFLDKSPATIRKWEEDRHFVFPRDKNGDRRFIAKDIREVVAKAAKMGRIGIHRQHFVESLMTMVEILENMNEKKEVRK
jgi:hypothetical protein